MEGVHFVAGPWFTVQQNGKQQRLDTIWVSDGQRNVTAHLGVKIRLRSIDSNNQK